LSIIFLSKFRTFVSLRLCVILVFFRRAEIAYLFGPRFWGQGYATEAMSVFQDHLRQNEHIAEFWATTAPTNTPSIRLLERLGYVPGITARPRLLSYEDGDLVFVLR
jgi:RimJ/RimL family protein N-acetyltransferase